MRMKRLFHGAKKTRFLPPQSIGISTKAYGAEPKQVIPFGYACTSCSSPGPEHNPGCSLPRGLRRNDNAEKLR
jgi:hypothetical protein